MSNNKTEPNEPAFACASDSGHQEGLTKREYFAAMAMQGIVVQRYVSDYNDRARLAKWSIEMADELIKALNK